MMRSLLLSFGVLLFSSPSWAIAVGQAPIFTSDTSPQTVNEAQTLQLTVEASDPDGTPVVLSAQGLPENATFENTGNGTATFVFSPNFDQAGNYTITLVATDGDNPPSETLQTLQVTVENVNRKPLLTTSSEAFANIDETTEIPLAAFDPDGDTVSFSVQGLPERASLVDNGNTAAKIVYSPIEDDLGSVTVTVTADDGQGGLVTTQIVINVIDPNAGQGCAVAAPSEGTSVVWLLGFFGLSLLLRRRTTK